MRVGIAADHGGFDLKEQLLVKLRAANHEITDFGAKSLAPDDDFPDFVIPLARAVVEAKVDRGLAVCGSGVGAAVCANKIKGARACLVSDHFSARQGVEDDHMNILCLGGPRDGTGAGMGYRSHVSRRRVRPGRTLSAAPRQNRGAGSEA